MGSYNRMLAIKTERHSDDRLKLKLNNFDDSTVLYSILLLFDNRNQNIKNMKNCIHVFFSKNLRL